MMKQWNTCGAVLILALFVGFVLFAATQLLADDVDPAPEEQSYGTVNSLAVNEENSAGNNPFWYGNFSFVLDETVYPGLIIVSDDLTQYGGTIQIGIDGSILSGVADELWAREVVGRPSLYPINAGDDVSLPTGNIEALTGQLISGTSISIDGTANPGTITESHGLLSFGDEDLMTQGAFRWVETGGGANYTGLQAPAALAGDTIHTWLDSFPAGNDYLVNCSVAGVLGYTDPSTIGGCCTLDETYDESASGVKKMIIDDGPLELEAADNYGVVLWVYDATLGEFKVWDDGCLLSEGTFGSGTAWPWAGAGTVCLFNPRTGAFRAGSVPGAQWDVGNIGDQSFGGGYGNIFSAAHSGGWGLNNVASGNYSGGWGNLNVFSGTGAGGWGGSNLAAGEYSAAIGRHMHLMAEADYSFAFGNRNTTLQLPESDTQYGIIEQHIIADPDTLGAEKLTNGTFTGNLLPWTNAAGWTYNSNAVDKDGDGVGTLSQAAGNMVTAPVANEIYLLTFTISNWTVGTCAPTVGGKAGAAVSANGTYRQLLLATNAGDLIFTPSNTARFTIDTVSLKEVTGGDMHVAGKIYAEGEELTPDTNTHVSQFRGYLSGVSNPPFDAWINLDPAATTAFAGTGVNDIMGYGLPWAVSIVGISANYLLADGDDVCTIDIYPREDGANINAACKLTLAETGLFRDSASTTFAPGTYTVSADQTLGIYIDVIGDTTGPNAMLRDLQVTVYYHYSL